jgi:monomeric type NADP-dependent isocitrate dehydrogenase
VYAKIAGHPQQTEVETAITQAIENGPGLAMVNSDKGITNLHVPSDVIVDASMPAMIRTSGQMWNSDNKLQDTIIDSLIRTLAFMRPLLNFVKECALTQQQWEVFQT